MGLVGGLLVALNGALVLAEHSLLTEALFVPVITATLVVLVAALRSGRLWLFALSGVLLGVATLTRPVAQGLVPLVPLGALLVTGWSRRALVQSVVALAAFGLVLVPWMFKSAAEHDTASVGSLGQSLVGRTARHDRGAFTYYDPAAPRLRGPGPHPGPQDPPAGG